VLVPLTASDENDDLPPLVIYQFFVVNSPSFVLCPSEKSPAAEKFPPVHASIDRFSLRKIASTTGGEYFELGTATDGQIASRIISLVQRRRISLNKTSQFEELYWYFILGAGVFVALGTFSLYK